MVSSVISELFGFGFGVFGELVGFRLQTGQRHWGAGGRYEQPP